MRGLRKFSRGAGALLDQAVIGFVGKRSAPKTSPAERDEAPLDYLARMTESYRDIELFGRPDTPDVRVDVVRQRGAEKVQDLSFRSTYRPHLEAYRDEHASYRENLTARARWVGTGKRPTVVLIHGWKSGSYFAFEHMFPLKTLSKLGFDYVMFQLPFHGERAPAQAPKSGQLFPSPNIARTNETFGQAISDLRQLSSFLRDAGAKDIGVMGLSLGGYTAALWSSLGDPLSFVVPIVPCADIAELMWHHGRGTRMQAMARNRGVTPGIVSEALSCHSPLRRVPTVPKERRFIVAGEGDRIAPPDQAKKLWAHWEQPGIHWFPGGHLAQFGRRKAYRAVECFLRSLG